MAIKIYVTPEGGGDARLGYDVLWGGGGRAITRAGLTNKQTKHMLRAPGLRGHQAVRSQKRGTREKK